MAFPIAYASAGDRKLFIRREWDDNSESYRLYGEAAKLATLVWSGSCPIAQLLDRLEEHPDECEATAETTADVVRWLRRKHESPDTTSETVPKSDQSS